MKKLLGEWLGASDEQAMWRVKHEDDPEAFAQLVRTWEGPIQRLCARMTGDPHKAEDIAQEVFAKLFARRKDYEPSGKFSTYLWRVALNAAYDELRRRKRRPEARLEPGREEENQVEHRTPAGALAREEQAERVRRALDALPEHYRAVLVLRHYEDLKFSQIAEVLGIPEGTVKSRMAYGLAQLHRALADELEPRPAERRPELMMI